LDTDLSGNEVMIPASTVALRTIAYNDQVAYPWFAPAGFTRGLVSNASSVGYLSATGAFQPVILNQGQRDILYGVRPTGCQINPIAYIPGRGLVVYGQKTLSGDSSALDRVNVTRLINYITYQLDNLLKPFLFEQNDTITQKAAKHTVEVFFNGLVNLRAITDYAVKCDSDNNTPDRINRNELWVDTAIIPEKSVEFIYIPVRVLAASSSPITLDSPTSSASANS
jgi:phage tail sheath protein FI